MKLCRYIFGKKLINHKQVLCELEDWDSCYIDLFLYEYVFFGIKYKKVKAIYPKMHFWECCLDGDFEYRKLQKYTVKVETQKLKEGI